MTDESQEVPERTIDLHVDPKRLVVAGAIIIRRLRAGCTPGELLDAIAEAGDIEPAEYRRLVLGILDGTEPGDLG